jgi:hypothetical protein
MKVGKFILPIIVLIGATLFFSIFIVKEVTQERMYLETMEQVLADINKIIIDKDSGSGVVPYLPLQELKSGAN